jgi:hypothetical protein
MKKRYRIHIDKELPSNQEIRKHQNFDSLLKDYKEMHSPLTLRQKMHRNRKILRIVLIAGLIVALMVLSIAEGNEHSSTEEKKITPDLVE